MKLKATPASISLAAGAGFSLWRLWEQSRLASKFVEAGIDPGDARVAAAQVLPFFSLTTSRAITDVLETSAMTEVQKLDSYSFMAEAAWIEAHPKLYANS